jgi:hypothetical protein
VAGRRLGRRRRGTGNFNIITLEIARVHCRENKTADLVKGSSRKFSRCWIEP